MKKETIIICLILLAALLVRLPGLGRPLYADELQFERFFCTGQYWLADYGHPSVGGWGSNLSCLVFGVSAWSVRLPILLLGLAAVYLTYWYGKRISSERTGLIAAAIMALSAWHDLASLAISADPSYLALFFLTSLGSYILWIRKPQRAHMLTMILSIGFAFITKSAAILIVLIIAIHQFILLAQRRQTFRKSLTLWPLALSLCIPLVYYVLQHVTGATVFTGYTQYRILHTFLFTSESRYFFPFASWVLTVVLGSVFLFLLMLLCVGPGRPKRDTLVFWLWFLVPAIVYSTIIINNAMERYMPISFPAMAILAAILVDRHADALARAGRSHRTGLILAGLVPILLLLAGYLYPTHAFVKPYYDASRYAAYLETGTMFFFPVLSDMGPTYFIPSGLLIASIIIAIVALLLWISVRDPRARTFILFGILCAYGTYHVLAISEEHFALTGPSITTLAAEADAAFPSVVKPSESALLIDQFGVSYPLRDQNLGSSLSSTPPDLNALYLRINATEGGTYTDPETGIRITKRSILLLRTPAEYAAHAADFTSFDVVLYADFPPLPDDNPVKQALARCAVARVFESRGIAFTYFRCRTP